MQRRFINIIIVIFIGAIIVAGGLFILKRHRAPISEERPGIVIPEFGKREEFKPGNENASERITIQAGREIELNFLQGFLHGVTYNAAEDNTKTVELISALRPQFWRLSNYSNNIYEFVTNEAKLPQRFGTKITFVLQDAFNNKYGSPVTVSSSCSERGCFSSFNELKSAWTTYLDTVMSEITRQNLKIEYFDVFNEPHYGWSGVKPNEFLELFKIAHDTVRKYQPSAKIVALSLGDIENNPNSFSAAFTLFLDFVVKNDLRLDAVSWHEFAAPEDIVGRVNLMKKLFSERPQLCSPACPEIHINEYASPESHLIPGVTAGWLYYMEKAGVNQAHRACWDTRDSQSGKEWSDCWDGFNGILLEDNITPQNLYWVHQSYASLAKGKRLRIETNKTRTVALASRDDEAKEMEIILGRYGYQGNKSDVAIKIESWPYGSEKVSAKIWKIPTNNNQPLALQAPISIAPQTFPVTNGNISIALSAVADGEVYYLTLRPK